MEKARNKPPIFVILFYVCVVLFLFVWLFVHFKTQNYFGENQFTGYSIAELNSGWQDAGGTALSLPGKYEVSAGEDFTICHEVTAELLQQGYLLFRTDHTFVTAALNGEVIYRFGVKEEIPFGNSPGSGWQLIPLTGAKPGDELSLTINCPYDKYSGLLRPIYLGTKSDLVSYIFWKGLAMMVLTMIPFIIGIFMILITPIFFWKYRLFNFVNIGLPVLIASVWSFTEARVWQMYFTNAYAVQLINFLTFSMAIPSFYWAVQILGFIPRNKWFYRLMTLNLLTALILLILQVLNIADYFNMLFVLHLVQGFDVLALVASFIKNKTQYRGLQRLLFILIYSAMVFAAVLDLCDFYLWDKFGNGYFSRIALLSILVCAAIFSLKQMLDTHAENIRRSAFEQLAYTDTLTSLRNRRGFDEDVDFLSKHLRKISILYADMNGLKRINDCLGHASGDNAIQIVAEQLKKFCGDGSTCYRLGGDEFCILSTSLTPEALEEHCRLANTALKEYEENFGGPIDISYAANAYDPAGSMTIYQCLTATDRKMYEYKNRVYQTRERYR